MLLNGMPLPVRHKPVIDIQMDFSVPGGFADCFDANGRYMGRFAMSTGKCPPEARTARVPPDTFFQMNRAA